MKIYYSKDIFFIKKYSYNKIKWDINLQENFLSILIYKIS